MRDFDEMVNAEITKGLLDAKARGDLPDEMEVHVVEGPILDRPIKVKETHDFGNGPESVEVDAYAVGDKGVFAITPQGNPAFMMWKVNHIPSGFMTMVSIDPVKDIAVLEAFNVDWSKEKPDGPEISKAAAYAREHTPNRAIGRGHTNGHTAPIDPGKPA